MPLANLLCRVCGAACHPRANRPLCTACARRHCSRCEAELAPGQKHRVCSDCNHKEAPSPWKGRSCRECGAPVHHSAIRLLCAACGPRFCSRCDQPKEPGRRDRWCAPCHKADSERHLAQPGRRCAGCHEEKPTPRSSYCSACKRADYEWKVSRAQRTERHCVVCGCVLPRGRVREQCRECLRQHRQELIARQGPKPCARCAKAIRRPWSSYCARCERMEQNWRAACHRGDKAARLLRPLGPRQRRQELDSR